MARIRLTSTFRPQLRDRVSPQPNIPVVKRNRLGRKNWRRRGRKVNRQKQKQRKTLDT